MTDDPLKKKLSIYNFLCILQSYTEKGYRVIGLSYKPMNMAWLKAQKVEREIIERDLIFLGLVVLKNQLKDNSTGEN